MEMAEGSEDNYPIDDRWIMKGFLKLSLSPNVSLYRKKSTAVNDLLSSLGTYYSNLYSLFPNNGDIYISTTHGCTWDR